MALISISKSYDDLGGGAFYFLESLVLRLLVLEANAHGRPFEIGSRELGRRWDAFAPKGIGDISSPLAVEVVRAVTPKILESYLSYLDKTGDSSLGILVISIEGVGSESKYYKVLKSNAAGRIHFWGMDEISGLMDKYPDAVKKIKQNPLKWVSDAAPSVADDAWKSRRDEVLSEVSSVFNSGRFSLFLGAGVSSSAGLPDWDTLLNSLFVSVLSRGENKAVDPDPDHISSIVKRLREVDGPSALVLARYVRKGMSALAGGDQSDFIGEVTSQLYALRKKNHAIASPLIKEIVSLCMPSRTGAKVRSVVTYNFDDLVERELEERGVLCRSIFEDLDLASAEELPVYHVHGFLPEDRSKFNNLEKSTLVFSEEGYHKIYGDAYHWSNLVQLNCLKESSCLMIGLSMTDPNLRRLLEISAKYADKPRHYAFLRRMTYDAFSKVDGKSIVRAPAQVLRDFLERHHRLNEGVMRELGISVIWYESYDEIPRILADMRRSIASIR